MKKISYNPFKMLGSYIGAVIFIYSATIAILVEQKAPVFLYFVAPIAFANDSEMFPTFLSAVFFIMGLLIFGFLIGWLIQLIFKSIRR